VSAAADGQIVVMRLGAMRLGDFLVTRLVEAVVHADDLDPEFAHDRRALAVVTRALADVLAADAPGRAVELRIPPFAAVQCVGGARHTRGTPRSAVETDPLTWVRVAAGRETWATAQRDGRLSASGERSDLSQYLPLLG
ncbi:MAG: sterol carrier family protein, partial [Carbonactinosporaceae bacterium]